MLKKEISDYISNALDICEKDGKKVIAYGIKESDGSQGIRLNVCDGTDGISDAIEMKRSELDKKIKEIQNFMNLDGIRDIRQIRNLITTALPQLPVISRCKNTGYQRDMNGNIVSYTGARCFNGRGEEMQKDIYASLPKCSGEVSGVIERLNTYMKKNIKRQAVLLSALSGAVCGLVKHNIILALIGESSRGKTTAMKLGASFFGETDYEGTVHTWATTQNALIKRMDGLSGVNVVIDDTQLSRMKDFQNAVYSLNSGDSFDRLEKGSRLVNKCHWYVSFGITAERSLIDTFHDKGAVGRIIEMSIKDDDLFDNTDEVGEMKSLYKDNFGMVGTEFIRKMLENHGESKIRQMVETEGAQLISRHKGETNGNTVLERHLENDIAVMAVTASLANQCLGFQFDTESITSSLLEICRENYRTFEQNTYSAYDIRAIYHDILSAGRKKYPHYERNRKIIIPSVLMKECINRNTEKHGIKAMRIKEKLAENGYLTERNGTYCWNHTINNESVTGYTILIREE